MTDLSGLPIYEVDVDHLKAEQKKREEDAKKRGSRGGDWNWYYLESGVQTFFYLLPPWSQKGWLGRPVAKHFQIPDDKVKYYLCWETHDPYEPGMGEKCPVCTALRSVQKTAGDKIRRMWPSRKCYVNVRIFGHRILEDPDNNKWSAFQPYTEEKFDEPWILELPPSKYDELIALIQAPGVGSIVKPDMAVLVMVQKVGEGLDTEYEVRLMGTDDPVAGFTPKRDNLIQTLFNGDMNKAKEFYGKVANLDKIWQMPDEEEKGTGHRIGTAIRARFMPETINLPGVSNSPGGGSIAGSGPTLPGGVVLPDLPTGVPAIPGGSKASTPAPAPAAPTPAPSPTPSQAAGPAPAPAPGPSPAAPAGTSSTASTAVGGAAPAPAAAPSAALSALLTTKSEDPKPPMADGKPVCFKSYNGMKSSPNVAWCATCTFQTPCRLTSPKV